MRVLIVDDEAPARAKLRRMLREYPDVCVVGEAANGAEAVTLLARLKPCAVFLDVQMPLLDGLAVCATLPVPRPEIVFVSAYERHAIDAFDVAATDYLLKPVDPARLQRTVQRLRTLRAATAAGPVAPAGPRLLVTDRGQTMVLDSSEIHWLGSEGNYVRVHVNGRSFLLRRTLTDLLSEIGSSVMRIHRTAAVSIAAVRTIRSRHKGDATVVLHDGSELPCSRQYRAFLIQRLHNNET